MAKKKKIYCRCGSECNWYKKGKNHRVLICNRCGLIANNPIPLIAGALAAAAPQIIEGVTGLISSKKKSTHETTPVQKFDSLDRPNYSERVINKVIKDEGLN